MTTADRTPDEDAELGRLRSAIAASYRDGETEGERQAEAAKDAALDEALDRLAVGEDGTAALQTVIDKLALVDQEEESS
jgi:hypothetical protein